MLVRFRGFGDYHPAGRRRFGRLGAGFPPGRPLGPPSDAVDDDFDALPLLPLLFTAGASYGITSSLHTPGAIRDEQDTVDGLVRALDVQIKASTTGAAFKTSWEIFRAEWARFYAEMSSVWPRLSGSSWTKTAEYRARVTDWRKAFSAEGGRPTGPETAAAAGAAPKTPTKGFPWGKVAGAAAIAAGIWGGRVLLKRYRVAERVGRAIRPT